MKILHLADLHIGKVVNGFSMLEDQAYILEQIQGMVREEQPRAVILAGDIYDRTVPGVDAVRLFDAFLTGLAELGTAVLFISGNHDAAERLGFAGRLLRTREVYVCGAYDGAVETVRLEQDGVTVCFHLLPYLRPSEVRRYFAEETIQTHSDAVRVALSEAKLAPDARNVLIAHQFVIAPGAAPERTDSEIEAVGGVDAVHAALMSGFDYVALGHLHGAQRIGADHIRYAGSPLKYSVSEHRHSKSACLITLGMEGAADIRLLPLVPMRDLRKIRGPLEGLIHPDTVAMGNAQDYVHVTLTDEDEPLEAMEALRAVYPHVMAMAYDNARTRAMGALSPLEPMERADPAALFADFYEQQNGQAMNDEQAAIVRALLAGAGGGL